MSRRRATVVAARATIGALLLGVPAALVLLAGNPLPTSSQWSAIIRLDPDWGNTVLLGSALPCVAWIAWALFAYPLIGELLRHYTGHAVVPVGAVLRGQQQIAAALVTAALLSSTPVLAAPLTTPAHAAQTTDPLPAAAQVDLAALRTTMNDGEAVSRQTRTTSSLTSYEVRSGDTLWAIAERRLGDGAEYPAIVERSVDLVQPGGRHLTDPDLILPGWHLDIPTTTLAKPHARPSATNPPPAPKSAVASAPPVTQSPAQGAPVSPGVTDSEAATTHRDAGSAQPGESHAGDAVPVAIGGGAAAILAAGLVTALTRRRRQQRAKRRFSERLPLSEDGPGRVLEEQLRAVSDPDAVESLHRALDVVRLAAVRNGVPLPRLFAVRVDEHELTLYLHNPAPLPSPFAPLFNDGTAWTAPRDAFSLLAEPHAAAPYPALVTIGTDLDGGILLLDLEQHTHLRLTSTSTSTSTSSTVVRGMLNALAAELASSPWGEGIHLSLVGVPERLVIELDPYRIHRVADVGTLIRDIRTHLADRRAALDAAGISDARIARTLYADVEAWAPFVVLIGTRPTAEEQTELDELIRQHAATGLVIVSMHIATSAAPEIVLTDTTATYRSNDFAIPPLPFIPQLLDEHTLEQALEIFAQSAAMSRNVELQSPQDGPHAAAGPRPLADTRTAPRDISVPSPLGRAPQAANSFEALADADGGHGHASDSDARAPYIRLLGQVEITHVERPELIPGRAVELLTYLLHHRQPIVGAQIQKALWPTTYDRSNGNLRTLAKQARAALGHDSDGHLWLPEGRGNAGFTTHPAVRSDWQEFQHMTGPDPTTVPTAQLATALRLVRGQPLLGTDGHRGRWTWRAPLEEAIIASIQDTSRVLADRAIADGERALIKLAVRAARFADPLSELSWQLELRAATPSTTSAEIDRIIADLCATAGYGAPDYEPDAETNALIRQARAATARRSS